MSGKFPAAGAAVTVAVGLAALAGLGAGAVWLAYRARPAPPPRPSAHAPPTDPRRAYAGPYRNIDPDVRYVGDAACAPCHDDIARSYARHPMGRSLAVVGDAPDQPPDTADVHNPFFAFGLRFRVDRADGRTRHRLALLDDAGRPLAESAQEVRWVIGSGAKGFSYLTERDGYVLQTPISWFTQQRRWDLSPGFGPGVLAGRLVPASCLFCHANRVREDPAHPDRFETPVFEGCAIGCERCHGPGELHARGDMDHAIVNPERLPPELRDAVCEQCHLEGEARVVRAGRGLFDYRPGMPLSDFWAVLVRAREGRASARAVNHVEQMVESKCFQRPVRTLQLGCITCHDPHVSVGPDGREAHYRAACLKCHDDAKGQRGCSEPSARRLQTSPHDSCIDCHMPRYSHSDVVHAASTDHRILRRPAAAPPAAPGDLDDARLVDFYQARFPQGDPQTDRTLGLGLVKMLTAGLLRPERHGEEALGRLESALGSDPADFELRANKAQLLLLLNRPAEALSQARAALADRPGDGRLLACAAEAAEAQGNAGLALDYWIGAVDANPVEPDHQVRLAALLMRAGRSDEARARCEQLLRVDPFNVEGRQLEVGLRLRDGEAAEARREFDLIRRLNPPDLPKREEWFRRQSEGSGR